MSRYLCTYEEIVTRVVEDVLYFLTEALRAHWICVQLAVYFSLQRFEFVESEERAFLIR